MYQCCKVSLFKFYHINLALKWTDIMSTETDTTFIAFQRISMATNWKEFRDAMKLFVVPGQNFVFASADGDIGYQMTGKLPVRRFRSIWRDPGSNRENAGRACLPTLSAFPVRCQARTRL